jgi:GNAT superfamily N-acetyltransferase
MNDFLEIADCRGTQVELRGFRPQDLESVEDFASRMPAHDLLFLGRDIQHPKVILAWSQAILEGDIVSLLAWVDGKVMGTSAIVRDQLSWSAHVAEIRLLVDEDMRGIGLGRLLLQHSYAQAVDDGAEKLIARMTPDQKGAIAMFGEMGFVQEALLADHVRDRHGDVHDLAIYSLNIGRVAASHAADGFTGKY